MRGSLRGVTSRVKRLARRLPHSSEPEWVARLPTMSDDELYARVVDAATKIGASTLENVFTIFHLDAQNRPIAREHVRRHWESREVT